MLLPGHAGVLCADRQRGPLHARRQWRVAQQVASAAAAEEPIAQRLTALRRAQCIHHDASSKRGSAYQNGMPVHAATPTYALVSRDVCEMPESMRRVQTRGRVRPSQQNLRWQMLLQRCVGPGAKGAEFGPVPERRWQRGRRG